MESFVMIVIGVLLAGLGIMNMRGNVSSIHAYNRRKVKVEDVKAYGKLVGLGTLVMGVCIILTGVAQFLQVSFSTDFVTITGVVIGLILILIGQFKYNKGIL